MLQGDSRQVAETSQHLIYDERATHYWDGDQSLGLLYGEIVELPMGRQLAWDIYFAYDEGAEWTGNPPPPAAWAHQLGRDDRHLGEGDKLREAVEAFLQETAVGTTD